MSLVVALALVKISNEMNKNGLKLSTADSMYHSRSCKRKTSSLFSFQLNDIGLQNRSIVLHFGFEAFDISLIKRYIYQRMACSGSGYFCQNQRKTFLFLFYR